MNNQEVSIVSLPPIRVASFHAFSSSPELDAWKKAYRTQEQGFIDDVSQQGYIRRAGTARAPVP